MVAEPEGQTVHLAVDWSVQVLFLPVLAEAPLVVAPVLLALVDLEARLPKVNSVVASKS